MRDLLLHRHDSTRQAKDFDVATSAHPEQVVAIFGSRRTIPTGIQHGTVTVLCDRLPDATASDATATSDKPRHVEVTTFRGETGYTDGRRPDRIEFISDLVEDLRRRDFTINAIAYDPLTHTLHDPFDGQGDLARRILRAVGDPAQRFAEDGLRLLRAVRFAAQLAFAIDPLTQHAFAGALPTLRKVSRERVRDELLRLMAAPQPSLGLCHLLQPPVSPDSGENTRFDSENSLLSVALPEVCDIFGADARAAADWMRLIDATDPARRVAALLWPLRTHALARSDAATDRRDSRLLSDLLDERLKLPLAQRQHLAALLLLPDVDYDACKPWGDGQLRRFLAAHPPDLVDDYLAIRRQELAQGGGDHSLKISLAELATRIAAERNKNPPLATSDLAISGRDLLAALGGPPGPWVGHVLRQLFEHVLDDPAHNQRDLLLSLARSLRPPAI